MAEIDQKRQDDNSTQQDAADAFNVEKDLAIIMISSLFSHQLFEDHAPRFIGSQHAAG